VQLKFTKFNVHSAAENHSIVRQSQTTIAIFPNMKMTEDSQAFDCTSLFSDTCRHWCGQGSISL